MSHCFFFNDTATTEIYTLSLHDALPISRRVGAHHAPRLAVEHAPRRLLGTRAQRPLARAALVRRPLLPTPRVLRDRKSTRLNSSHANISYAVFCLKKKKSNHINTS